MTSRAAGLHVISRRRIALFRALFCDLSENVRVRYWEAAPGPSSVLATDVLVVDLLDTVSAIRPAAIYALVDRVTLWLVTGESQIDPAWLEIASNNRTTVIRCNPKRPGNVFEPVAAALREYLRGPSAERLAALTLGREPFLAPAAKLVRAICSHACQIRRPSDLARIAGAHPERVRRTCFQLGFTRVEHFITCVRMITLEQLVVEERLPLDLARRQVGIDDPSNMRRQLDRARHRSSEAWQRLRSVVGSERAPSS